MRCLVLVIGFLAGCGQAAPPADQSRAAEGMKKYVYQCWDGGPHILLPNELERHWLGVGKDYDRACAVPGDFGLIPVASGYALVLAGSPPMVAWDPRPSSGVHHVFILNSWNVENLDALLDSALAAAAWKATDLKWTIGAPGAALYFAGDIPAEPVAGKVDVSLAAGTYRISRSDYTDPTKGDVVVIQLTPTEAP